MKKISIAILITSVVWAFGFCLNAAVNPATEDVEHQVRKVEMDWDKAQLHGEMSEIDRILSDDFNAITDGKVISRSQLIESLRSGDLKFEVHESTPEEVRIYDNTAVVIGHTILKGVFQGERMDSKIRYTRVYVQQQGSWRLVVAHSSTLKKPSQ